MKNYNKDEVLQWFSTLDKYELEDFRVFIIERQFKEMYPTFETWLDIFYGSLKDINFHFTWFSDNKSTLEAAYLRHENPRITAKDYDY